MDIFFQPRSVVVVGASNGIFNLGATICNMLSAANESGICKVDAYAVNRKGEDVKGCQGFAAVTDIPCEVDLAVILAPAKVVPEFVRQCGEKGIKRIIIESSGFSEAGAEGEALQAEIDAHARAYGMRILGPNCLGVLNFRNKFCCFYGIREEDMKVFANETSGTISYIIQSGGIIVTILESLVTDVVQVSKVVSIGNKCDIDEADMIRYFGQDDSTEVIGMYIENIREGRRFMQAALETGKPLLAFKVGRTGAGAQAAMSHTAGMANNDLLFENACRQAGVIRLKSISELHSLPKIFGTMPPLKGKRIAVFTNSGAFGCNAADLLVESGLVMADLSPDTRQRLQQTGQLFNASNPIDVGPTVSMETFMNIFDILLSSDEVDGLLPILSLWHPMVIEAVKKLVDKCGHYKKPAAVYTPNAGAKTVAYRSSSKVPLFESPEEAVRALAVSHQHFTYAQRKQASPVSGLFIEQGGCSR